MITYNNKEKFIKILYIRVCLSVDDCVGLLLLRHYISGGSKSHFINHCNYRSISSYEIHLVLQLYHLYLNILNMFLNDIFNEIFLIYNMTRFIIEFLNSLFRLPFPWLLWTAVNGTGLSVSSKGAACSISMLFLMLILVFLSILTFKWKMTKAMGGVMLVLYVVFVIVSLGFSFGWYECPV